MIEQKRRSKTIFQPKVGKWGLYFCPVFDQKINSNVGDPMTQLEGKCVNPKTNNNSLFITRIN